MSEVKLSPEVGVGADTDWKALARKVCLPPEASATQQAVEKMVVDAIVAASDASMTGKLPFICYGAAGYRAGESLLEHLIQFAAGADYDDLVAEIHALHREAKQ